MIMFFVSLLLAAQLLFAPQAAAPTYAQMGAQATATITQRWFSSGKWRYCLSSVCGTHSSDWGADSMTFSLYERWAFTHDRTLVPYFRGIEQNAPYYGTPCTTTSCGWSDVPMWDSIAASRDYAVTGDSLALSKAKAAFHFIDGATTFNSSGACRSINYQRPGGSTGLKTLETDANYVKAALLLYGETHDASYLSKAQAKYAAIRTYFLDSHLPLYSVYVFDQGGACTQIPRRFFASVNGDMITSGLLLYAATNNGTYAADAIVTGEAVAANLSDPNGVFADLQADNDIVEPLVEAMHDLFANGQVFAGQWLLKNASAGAGAMETTGSYGRFFDGPVPNGGITAFSGNGGFALAIAAADVGGAQTITPQSDWSSAVYTSKALGVNSSVTFTGTAIALIGTLGDKCCSQGHARVFVDGLETTNEVGIWQNKSSASIRIANSILFAWRWPNSGTHTVSFAPGIYDPKEGGSYLNLAGYFVKP